MEKIKGILVGVFFLLFLIFVIATIISIPRYPAFKKEVNSFDSLKKSLSGEDTPIFPDLSTLNLTEQTYSLVLDGRFLYSKPIGYLISGECCYPETRICFSVNVKCEKRQNSNFREDMVYRGVKITVSERKSEIARGLGLFFWIDGFKYEVEAGYITGELTSEEQAEINGQIYNKLVAVVQQMIDTYVEH